MSTSLFLKVDGIQGTANILSYQGAIQVSTFEMRGPVGGVSPNEMRGPVGGIGINQGAAGELIVTMEGGSALAQLSQAFIAKKVFANAWLIVEEETRAPIEFAFVSLLVVGISGIADDEGAEYQVVFSYADVSQN